jgi:high-affinity iron transporter
MEAFIQALIMSFREGLEAFLIIAILLKFLEKTDSKNLKRSVWYGTSVGIVGSLLLGILLMMISSLMGGTDAFGELWESIGNLIAVVLITTFMIWMIKNGSRIKHEIESKASLNLSKYGIFLIALIMVLREGAEIAIFSFAGRYTFIPVIIGLLISFALAVLVYYSVVKVKLSTIFNITLAYLVLQSGLMIGISIHGGLHAAGGLGMISEDGPFFAKPFDLTNTLFDHESGFIGVPLYIAFGWFSDPEWSQFIVQYAYTILLFAYWYYRKPKNQ